MRSVVVVLPASMCAMIPMLRTLVRSVRTSSANVIVSSRSLRKVRGGAWWARPRPHASGMPRACVAPAAYRSLLPAVVREGLVGLGHLVGVLATLHRGAEAVGRVEDLVHEPLGHGLLTTLTRVADHPAQGQRGRAVGLDLDRHLVGGATDTTRLDLERRTDVVQRALEGHDGVGAGLLLDALEGAVDDRLGDGLLAIEEDLVDQLGHQRGVVDRVDDEGALGRGSLARHYFFSIFAP